MTKDTPKTQFDALAVKFPASHSSNGVDMAPNIDERDALEALVNLFYLIRRVEAGSLQQHLYLEMAENVVNREIERIGPGKTLNQPSW